MAGTGGGQAGSWAPGPAPTQRTYVLGVPGLVAWRRAGQEGNIGHEDGQQQQGAHDLPGRPPVEARPPPGHPGYVITEPATGTPSSGRQPPSCRQAVAHGTVPASTLTSVPVFPSGPWTRRPPRVLVRTRPAPRSMVGKARGGGPSPGSGRTHGLALVRGLRLGKSREAPTSCRGDATPDLGPRTGTEAQDTQQPPHTQEGVSAAQDPSPGPPACPRPSQLSSSGHLRGPF